MDAVEFRESKDSREWLLASRGAELEPWEEAAANLPGAAESVAAVLCVAKTAPTLWIRDDVVDDLTVWDALQAAVWQYDGGDRNPDTWTPVLGGEGHLAVFGQA